jgi:hypothetical protein
MEGKMRLNMGKKIPHIILSLCLLFTFSGAYAASAESLPGSSISLINQLPQRTNGDQGIFVEYRLPNDVQDSTISDGDIAFKRLYTIDEENQKIEFSSFFDQKKANSILRLPLQGNLGAIHVSGEAGIDGSNQAFFSIDVEKDGERTPLWEPGNGGGSFDLTIPTQSGESLFFTVKGKDRSPIEGAFWKNIHFEETQVIQERLISSVQIPADKDPSLDLWTDSGLNVNEDEILSIHAEGVARHGMDKKYTKWYSTLPDGKRYFLQNRRQSEQPSLYDDKAILATAPVGALVGIIQLPDGSWSDPFLIGSRANLRSPAAGKFYLGYNDVAGSYVDNSGSYTAEIHLFDSDSNIALDQPKGVLDHLEVSNDFFRLPPGKSASFKVFAVDREGNQQEITRDKQVTYTSDSPDIMKATGATLRAGKTEGSATITVSYQGLSTTVKGLVSSSFPKSFRASPSQYTLSLGDSSQLSVDASFLDHSYDDIARYMDWHSEDSEIASVDGTKITANAPGTTTIIGNYYDMSQVKVQVTVNLKPLVKIEPVERSITLKTSNSKSIIINGINNNKEAFADYTDKVEWNVNKPDILEVKDGIITAKSKGTAVITASYYNLKTTISVKVVD